LRWLLESDEALAERVSSGEVCFGTIDTYLIHRMTGGRVYATDHTNASRTMLYNLSTRTWDPLLCGKFGLCETQLATILPCDAHFGETTLDGILPAPLPIIGVMGDSQAALFAQRCFTKGSAKVTLGTGSSMLYNIGSEGTFSKNGVVTTLASVIQGTPTYSFEGIIRFSSATMDWLKNQLGLFESIQEADRIAAALEDSGGVFVVPAFTGLGAPYWNPGVRAAILGLTPHSNRAHIIRAGFESMGFQVRDVLEMMELEVGARCERLHVDGGPTRSAFLMQLLADILQRPIAVSKVAECSALGAVMAGLIGSGAVPSVQTLEALPRDEITYRPVALRARMDALYEQWKSKVNQLNHLSFS
jgi:glycerol kinase